MKVASSSLVLGLGGLLALGGISAANANTVTFTDTFGPGAVGPTSVLLTPFNPALGTLNSVTVTLNTSFTAATGVLNTNGNAVVITDAFTEEQIGATGPGGLSVGPVDLTSDSGPVAVPLGPGGSTVIGGALATGSAGPVTTTANLAAYENAVTAIINITNPFVAAGGQGGANNIFYGGGGTLSGSVVVVYDYTTSVTTTSTPEPGSLAMFAGMGVTGSLFAFRRRARRN